MGRIKPWAIWAALLIALLGPLALSLQSPLLAWRDPVYIAAGVAGIVAMGLLLLQPMLVGGLIPGIPRPRGRLVHRWIGAGLVGAVVIHVIGLWITSPPDVVDALTFSSPTPFSAWGVIAMWGVFAAALLAILRRRLRLAPRLWRRMHTSCTVIVVLGSVIHAALIVGTMETVSKLALSALVVIVTGTVLWTLRIWGGGVRAKENAAEP